MTTLKYNLPCFHKWSSEVHFHTRCAIPGAHMVTLKGKHLQLLRFPNGTYINQGKMDGASNVGLWRAMNLGAPSFIHCIQFLIWGWGSVGGALPEDSPSQSVLSIHDTNRVASAFPNCPPSQVTESRGRDDVQRNLAWDVQMLGPISVFLSDAERQTHHVCGKRYVLGQFLSGGRIQGSSARQISLMLPLPPYLLDFRGVWIFALPFLPQNLCVLFWWL